MEASLFPFEDTVTDFTSGDNADDERSAGEDTDYDKQFDEDLLRIAAAESKVEKERPRFENAVKEDMHRQKKTHKRNILSDFEGEIVAKEDFKRVSSDEDEDKRPMAKKNKGNDSLSTDIKESQENEKFVRRFHELQLNLQVCSLRVDTKFFLESWKIFVNTRREISYLQLVI